MPNPKAPRRTVRAKVHEGIASPPMGRLYRLGFPEDKAGPIIEDWRRMTPAEQEEAMMMFDALSDDELREKIAEAKVQVEGDGG